MPIRLLAAAALAGAAFAGPATAAQPLPGAPFENCEPGRTQVLCQTGRCDPEMGCQIWYCVVWTKGVCVG